MTTATESYEVKRKKVANQLARLAQQLKEMDKSQQSNPYNWGIVGDLGRVNDGLENVLTSIMPEITEPF